MSRSGLLPLLLLAAAGCGPKADDSAATAERVTIVHTNDLHSHLVGWGPEAEYTPGSPGDDGTVGGAARIAARIAEIRATTDHPVLVLDAGDWLAGTLFQLLGPTEAPELQFFQAAGYDAITLGNHEFDWGPEVLAQVFAAAEARGVTVPVVAANMAFDAADPGDDALAALVDAGRITPTQILTLDGGLTVGLFGILGEDAESVAPAAAPASFDDPEDVSAEMVAALQAEGVDLVVALTHNGVTDDPATSPDELLAAEVPGIHVIVGGHSHTVLAAPTVVGGVPIVQTGAYGAYLGQLDLVREGDGWAVEAYTLHPVDDSLAGDAAVDALVTGFRDTLDADFLPPTGYTYDTPIARVPEAVVVVPCGESGLGNLVTDAFREQMNLLRPDTPIDFAFESQGVIRDDLLAGDSGLQTFADIFRALPLGSGSDDLPGYGLVDFWVTAGELLDTCEVTASISPSYGCNYFIEVSGLRCNMDWGHSTFNRARSVDRWTGTDWAPLDTTDDETLYHVAVDSYVASLMGILESLTYGAIVITPKAADGTPHEGVQDMLFDADPEAEGVQELKLWQALAAHLLSFPDEDADGISDVPARYTGPEGRIVGYEGR